jgi:uncharacterized protein YbaR (Trm112 family)
MQKFDIKLLEIIICPITKEKLSYDQEQNLLINQSQSYAYQIIDNIPILLVDEVIKLT